MWKDLPPRRRAEATLLCVFGIWLALVFIAPLTLPSGSVPDLSGSVGTIDNWQEIEHMNPLAGAVYLIGDSECHQLLVRSFTINGNQMPFCTRDLGIFIGLVVGIGIAFSGRLRIGPKLSLLLLIPMALDGGAQLISSYESSNIIRMVTGMVAGIGVAFLLDWFAARVLEPTAKVESSKSDDARGSG